MIERTIVKEEFLRYSVDKYIREKLSDVAIKEITLEKTPIGEKITIYSSTPGLIIGKNGSNIKKLTEEVKLKFNFDNPQLKIGEVKEPYLSAKIVAKIIANNLARYGSQKFKLTGFKAVTNVMAAGAIGVEIRITGKVPSSRAKSWRFFKGYIKKTGYVSDYLIDKAIERITLKSGVLGIKVTIMKPNTPLPDKVVLKETIYNDKNSVGYEETEEVLEEKEEKFINKQRQNKFEKGKRFKKFPNKKFNKNFKKEEKIEVKKENEKERV